MPLYDNIVDALAVIVDGSPHNVSMDTQGATYEGNEATYGEGWEGVWLKVDLSGYSAGQPVDITVSLTKTGGDAGFDPYLDVFKVIDNTWDPSSPDFQKVTYVSGEYIGDGTTTPSGVINLLGGTGSSAGARSQTGIFYLFLTDWNFVGYGVTDVTYDADVSAGPPANDNWVNRIVLDSKYKTCIDGTTDGATFQASGYEPNINPSGDNLSDGKTVWYEWESPNYNNEPLNVTFELVGATTPYYIELVSGNPFSMTVTDSVKNATLTESMNGFDTRRIRVSTPAGSSTDFELVIKVVPGGSPPSNDNWASAEVLTGSSDSASGTTVGATGECDDPFDDVYWYEATNNVWYKWTPPQTGRTIVTAESSTLDLMMFVARGSTLAGLEIIKDVSMFVQGFEDYMAFTAEAGHDYYFAVQGWGGDEGTFDIAIEQNTDSPPANNEPANAIVLNTGTNGTLTQENAGANWDSEGPYEGHFVDNASQDITVWWKIVAAENGNLVLTYNTEDVYGTIWESFRSPVTVWQGDTIGVATQLTEIYEVDHPTQPFTAEVAIAARETYWIANTSYFWNVAVDIDYEFYPETTNPPVTPGGIGDFDAVTGGFVYDEEDGEFVASGTDGYGTLEPFPDGHYAYGWWTRFYWRNSSGEYLYRYGQSAQFFEIFRATKENADYESIVVLGHRTGVQTIAVAQNGSVVHDTGYKVGGSNGQGTNGRIRIEVGRNGVTVDGRCFVQETYFQDDYTNQFVSFDYGIRGYPTDGTSYVDLDPEWDSRFSGIVLHDEPARNVIGQLDVTLPEVTAIRGWTSGQLFNTQQPFMIDYISDSNLPAVVASSGDYTGYSLDCSETGTTNLNACGVVISPTGGTLDSRYVEPVRDSYFPGMSFRFWIDIMPTATVFIASIRTANAASGAINGTWFALGPDGTLYIKPSYDSDLIPFCSTEIDKWNYIELQADTHTRTYATKIWLDTAYMGRFEATSVPSDTARVPNSPPHWASYLIGRLGEPASMGSGDLSDIPVSFEIRDVAITRHKHDRPLGPTVIIPVTLDGTGTHQIDDDPLPNATEIGFNSDFSGTPDGAGQPQYWTGWDRHDAGRPLGAMYLAYLFQTFPDSTVAQGTGEMTVTATGTIAAAAYVFGGATEPATETHYDYEYADTICAEFEIDGIAGHTVEAYATTNSGDWTNFNTVTLDGTTQKVRCYLTPQSTAAPIIQVTSIVILFPDATVGDVYTIRDFHLYLNPEDQPAKFYETGNNGTTTTEILPADTTSHTRIDEFPPSANSDHIYLSTQSLKNRVRGKEDDEKTHMPPVWSDDYLEYYFDEYNPEEGRVFGARLLLAIKGYNGIDPTNDDVDFTNFESGKTTVVISDGDGRRYTGEFTSEIGGLPETTIYGINLPLPPDQGEWTITKWNEFLLRFGYHDTFFQNSSFIISDFSDGGVVEGVAAELLVYDRRLSPPTCVRPIDLSRVRFRAWEENEID